MNAAAIAKVVTVDGWELRVGDDGEPTVRDITLAEHLGFTRPADIRKLVERMLSRGFMKESDVRATVARTSMKMPNGGTRSWAVTEYSLTEAGALRVIAKSETKKADAILGQMIDVFIAARRGLLVPAAPVSTVLPTESATTTRTGDVPNVKSDISMLCKMVARSTARPLQAIHGYVRKTFRTVGIHQLPIGLWPAAKDMLNALAMGTLLLPPRARVPLRLVANNDPKQQTLPGIEAK